MSHLLTDILNPTWNVQEELKTECPKWDCRSANISKIKCGGVCNDCGHEDDINIFYESAEVSATWQ